MNEREIAQLQTERDQAVARLRVANGHTEDAFKKLQTAQHEIDILRRSLSKAHDRLEKMQRDWTAEITRVSAERDEARHWSKRLMREQNAKGMESFFDHRSGVSWRSPRE